jgi:hypothetical protein
MTGSAVVAQGDDCPAVFCTEAAFHLGLVARHRIACLHLWLVLKRHADSQTGRVEFAVSHLARLALATPYAVAVALALLTKAGLLAELEGGQDRRRAYVIREPGCDASGTITFRDYRPAFYFEDRAAAGCVDGGAILGAADFDRLLGYKQAALVAAVLHQLERARLERERGCAATTLESLADRAD